MKLAGKKVLTVIENDFEDSELIYPHYRLQEEGAAAHIAGKEANKTYVGKNGVPVMSDYAFEQINIEDYDILLVPGGWAPDKLRRYDEVLSFVKYMNDHNRVIGQICHAGWVLISAGILQGKKTTSTPGIKDDMINAGSEWVNEAVVTDGKLVSSRRPPDLPAYGKALIEAASK
ncbi:type 1 glutamine amidotransferase domain-containing protein [Salisediminibacterium halotolerans]|uniref:type 1 glutamine amidotransferase domain-containing protein n=1 Tax=Salisediminibacterium halotolerans TaxID=517425 RepID=UPI000EAFE630|nr:type 1 glutamine amidotransferase domain-containing protein [Salisediminibacterium halotolerans]RLJ74088.1 protease I [Actinophytocola xinjiangensis]RPE87819.1 protease I [Salisediminibacterium halotolerans]TWG34925.1 protease I [Salisediminibacterium halotolerans]GEL07888.1 protease [Salisediminibacterium halotolerans]